ncbi:MAG: hypothetical protein ACI8RD_007398 [Bacillariaceae sp.]|jgi:hypothetical protein
MLQSHVDDQNIIINKSKQDFSDLSVVVLPNVTLSIGCEASMSRGEWKEMKKYDYKQNVHC